MFIINCPSLPFLSSKPVVDVYSNLTDWNQAVAHLALLHDIPYEEFTLEHATDEQIAEYNCWEEMHDQMIYDWLNRD